MKAVTFTVTPATPSPRAVCAARCGSIATTSITPDWLQYPSPYYKLHLKDDQRSGCAVVIDLIGAPARSGMSPRVSITMTLGEPSLGRCELAGLAGIGNP